jgi:hypothetical protein
MMNGQPIASESVQNPERNYPTTTQDWYELNRQ